MGGCSRPEKSVKLSLGNFDGYGNLFDMYNRITDDNPYKEPMMIYPAVHYTMGGLWVDYNLMSNLPGLFVLGEANFSDHGANRLGASALMQGLADGYFILPYTIGNYLSKQEYEIDLLYNHKIDQKSAVSVFQYVSKNEKVPELTPYLSLLEYDEKLESLVLKIGYWQKLIGFQKIK